MTSKQFAIRHRVAPSVSTFHSAEECVCCHLVEIFAISPSQECSLACPNVSSNPREARVDDSEYDLITLCSACHATVHHGEVIPSVR
jgi:hypothetical protein